MQDQTMVRQRLQRFIKERGTQQQFAESMGLRRETVSRAVTGSDPIGSGFKVRFLDTFGIAAYAEIFSDGEAESTPCPEATA